MEIGPLKRVTVPRIIAANGIRGQPQGMLACRHRRHRRSMRTSRWELKGARVTLRPRALNAIGGLLQVLAPPPPQHECIHLAEYFGSHVLAG
jgi:hypothetical protein